MYAKQGVIMSAVKGLVRLGAVLAMAAVLTACGGAPSESDVRNAFAAAIAEQTPLPESGLTEADKKLAELMPNIEVLSLGSCEAAENDVYMCLVEAKITVMGRSATTTQKVGLKKDTAGDWIIVD